MRNMMLAYGKRGAWIMQKVLFISASAILTTISVAAAQQVERYRPEMKYQDQGFNETIGGMGDWTTRGLTGRTFLLDQQLRAERVTREGKRGSGSARAAVRTPSPAATPSRSQNTPAAEAD